MTYSVCYRAAGVMVVETQPLENHRKRFSTLWKQVTASVAGF